MDYYQPQKNAKLDDIDEINKIDEIDDINDIDKIWSDYYQPEQESFLMTNRKEKKKKKNIKSKMLLNITEASIIVTHIFEKIVKNNLIIQNDSLKLGDYIYSINTNIIDSNGYIYYDKLNISIPLNTYLYYTSNLNHKFEIIRNNINKTIIITPCKLTDQINFKISPLTTFNIKDNIIFTKPNLLMIEWLTYNNIIIKNNLYLQYMINPFYKTKQNNLMVGLININQHPNSIKDIIKPYIDYIYNIDKYIELFTVLSVNTANSSKIDNHKTINKLILSDSNESEIFFNWLTT